MLHKIRSQMYLANENLLMGEVETGETLIGGRTINSHWNKKMAYSQGHSHKDKTPVVGMIQWDSLIVYRLIIIVILITRNKQTDT